MDCILAKYWRFCIKSNSYIQMPSGKIIAMTLWTFVSKVVCLLFNTLSRFVTAFLQRSKHLLISWLLSLFPFFPHLFAVKTRCHDLSFLNSEFKDSFITFLFDLHQGAFFSSFSLCAVRVVSPTYLRLLMFLLAVLIPACASSSPTFPMVYSAYKLNKESDNIQPWCIPFPIWNQSVVPCPLLTVASWPAYRFLMRHEAGQVVWYSHLFQNLSLLWSTIQCSVQVTTASGSRLNCV